MSLGYDAGANWRDQTNQDLILLDEEFLATLSEQKDRQIYARIIALDINENPIDQIEGRVTGGSINIDGNSTVRRTCSLTLVSDQVDINDFYWGIKTKFRLFIGLQNNLVGDYAYVEDGQYPKIVWFPEGMFVVGGFNTSISTNSATISISGKDKMSLLNGDLGGQLFASIDFGTEETKIETMENADIIDDTSDTIMSRQYYFEPNENLPALIAAADNKYVFTLDDTGCYYKDGNVYRKLLEGENLPEKYSKYKMYKQVELPSELFLAKGQNESYIKGKYFYEKDNNQYYVRDKSSTGTDGRGYFQLKQLYTLGYEITIKKIPLEKIIRESVHAYAGEPYHNIIINDLEEYGLDQMSYRGDKDLLALRNCATGEFYNMQFMESFKNSCSSWWSGENQDVDDISQVVIDRDETNNNPIYFIPDSLTSEMTSSSGTILYIDDGVYKIYNGTYETFLSTPQENRPKCITVAKITYGMDIGYRLTDLVYTGDLISNIGDSLTSVLDKIKTMLGDFEYFYDINGRFIFQRKPIYVNTSWSQLTETEDESYVTFGNDKKKFSFNFEGNRLISAIQNSPVLNNLRNDFVVWGKRKSISGAEIPIHARYAIDRKPVYYKALSNEIYTTDIEYAYEQIPDFQPKTQQSINEALQEKLTALANFEFQHPIPAALHLASPIRKGQYDWEPGWWDIRDWASYYKLVTGEDINPNGTMKFYSSNDEYGCIPLNKLIEDGVPVPTGYNSNYYTNSCVWLIEITSSGYMNFGHGIGQYNVGYTRLCSYYTSTLIDNQLNTTKTDQTGYFHRPYADCSDTHTYLYFLNQIERDYAQNGDNAKAAVYFYNPRFPFGQTEEETIISSITKDRETDLKKYHIHIVDWRELIYQMALDFFAGQGCSDSNPIYTWEPDNEENRTARVCFDDPDHFLYEVGIRNPYYYPTGYTGYEQYYTDMQGFWRQLYNPDYIPELVYEKGFYTTVNEQINGSQYYIKKKVWIDEKAVDVNVDYYFYDDEEENNLIALQYNNIKNNATLQLIYNSYRVTKRDFFAQNEMGRRLYWNRAVFEAPETLNFWFDFLDSDTELAAFSVKSVGDRTKVINEDKARAIFYKEIPNVILYDINEATGTGEDRTADITKLRRDIIQKSGYVFIYLPKGFSQYLTISYRGVSVKNKIDDLIYQFSYCIENISITSIPVYYLQPNTRIYVQDKTTGIEGEYIVNKITIPLTYNGTMSISAVKAPERLY